MPSLTTNVLGYIPEPGYIPSPGYAPPSPDESRDMGKYIYTVFVHYRIPFDADLGATHATALLADPILADILEGILIYAYCDIVFHGDHRMTKYISSLLADPTIAAEMWPSSPMFPRRLKAIVTEYISQQREILAAIANEHA